MALVPPHQAGVAAGHARRLGWISVVGGIIAAIGAAMLVSTAFAPHATWSLWLSPATFLVWGAIFLFFGFNARRAARVYHHPDG
jgi:cytochrome c-type biogenesis protein CcmH/NrfF